MFLTGLLVLGLGTAGCPAPFLSSAPDSLGRLYQSGSTYREFLDLAQARRETWLDNTRAASVDSAVVARVHALGGEWRLRAVAEDWCGDSAHTIPSMPRGPTACRGCRSGSSTPARGAG